MRGSRKKETDEVAQLLEAAQDEVMLKLSVDSHMSRVAPDYIPSDIHRRFRALRSPPTAPPPSNRQENRNQPPGSRDPDAESKEVSDADLFSRFAALKASLPSSSATCSDPADPRKSGGDDDGDVDEEDEVEKLMRWATDAARLDPSPPSDDDDDDDGDDTDDHDSVSSDDDDDDDHIDNKSVSKRRVHK